jgi:hypothetical protein
MLLAGAACAATPALAQQVPAETPNDQQAFSAVVDGRPIGEARIADAREPAPIDEADLKELRGGETIMVANQTLTGITSGNVINGNYTAGNVSLSDHALSNFTGLGNLSINTGAMVSLQAGMNLTINVGN